MLLAEYLSNQNETYRYMSDELMTSHHVTAAILEFKKIRLNNFRKDSLSTTMQRTPKRRFRGPRNPKVLRRHLKDVEICLHPSHASVEWIEIFLWSYEIYQGTIGAVLI